MRNLSTRIKNSRKSKDITQEQLAEILGVSTQAVSRWECGITCPDIMLLPRLAEIFGITVDELLGVNEKEKMQEINSIIEEAEANIDNNHTVEPIVSLRAALQKYPNNDRLLCTLMYALYVACEDEELCKEYDEEIIAISDWIRKYSIDDDCRNEAKRLIFRHYCDTGRKSDAMKIAGTMADIETSRQRNLYWVLEGEEKVNFVKARIFDDLKYLIWDINTYSNLEDISDIEKAKIGELCDNIKTAVENQFA